MKGIVALAALASVGAFGVRKLLLSKRRVKTATANPSDEPEPVTPTAADRCITIVDNGGTPFAVRLSYKRRVATVYKIHWEDGKTDDTSTVLRSFRYRRVFIGQDPEELKLEAEAKSDNGTHSPPAAAAAPEADDKPAPWWYGGNSVLLDLGRRRYVFIGVIIYAFTSYDDIIDYVSSMGNNAVPYPYAVGTKNTYLMIEYTYVPNWMIKSMVKIMDMFRIEESRNDPYKFLYRMWDSSIWEPRTRQSRERRWLAKTWTQSYQFKDYELLVERQ